MNQPRQQYTLHLESRLVIRICQHEEDILKYREEIGLEETIGDGEIRVGNVVDHLETQVETCISDIPHGVLDCPDDAIHRELELGGRQLEQCGEAVQIDRSQEFEESNAMLGELGEVLVDHVERRLEDSIEDCRHILSEQ